MPGGTTYAVNAGPVVMPPANLAPTVQPIVNTPSWQPDPAMQVQPVSRPDTSPSFQPPPSSFTTSFSPESISNPIARESFAPQIQQNIEQNRYAAQAGYRNAGLAMRQQSLELRQQEEAQRMKREQDKTDLQQKNAASEQEMTSKGLQFKKLSDGTLQPITDEKGNPQYKPIGAKEAPIEYDDKTGKAFQTLRDVAGATRQVDPDANAPLQSWTDDSGQGWVVKQNKHNDWQYTKPEDAIASGDPKFQMTGAKILHGKAMEQATSGIENINQTLTNKGYEPTLTAKAMADKQEQLSEYQSVLKDGPPKPRPPSFFGLGPSSTTPDPTELANYNEAKQGAAQIQEHLDLLKQRQQLNQQSSALKQVGPQGFLKQYLSGEKKNDSAGNLASPPLSGTVQSPSSAPSGQSQAAVPDSSSTDPNSITGSVSGAYDQKPPTSGGSDLANWTKVAAGNIAAGFGDVMGGLAHLAGYATGEAPLNALAKGIASVLPSDQQKWLNAAIAKNESASPFGMTEKEMAILTKKGEQATNPAQASSDNLIQGDASKLSTIGSWTAGAARYVPSMVTTAGLAPLLAASQFGEQAKNEAVASGKSITAKEGAFGINALAGAALSKIVGMAPWLKEAQSSAPILKALQSGTLGKDMAISAAKGLARASIEGAGFSEAQQIGRGENPWSTNSEEATKHSKEDMLMVANIAPFAILGPFFKGLGAIDANRKINKIVAETNKNAPPDSATVTKADVVNSLVQQNQAYQTGRAIANLGREYKSIDINPSLSPEQRSQKKANAVAKLPNDIRPAVQAHLELTQDQQQANLKAIQASRANIPPANPNLAKLSDVELQGELAGTNPPNHPSDPHPKYGIVPKEQIQLEIDRRNAEKLADIQVQPELTRIQQEFADKSNRISAAAQSPEGLALLDGVNRHNAALPPGMPKADLDTAQLASDISPKTDQRANVQPHMLAYLPLAHDVEAIPDPKDRDFAQTALKILNGREIDPTATKALIGGESKGKTPPELPTHVGASGMPFARKDEAGNLILTDEGLNKLRQLVPASVPMLSKDGMPLTSQHLAEQLQKNKSRKNVDVKHNVPRAKAIQTHEGVEGMQSMHKSKGKSLSILPIVQGGLYAEVEKNPQTQHRTAQEDERAKLPPLLREKGNGGKGTMQDVRSESGSSPSELQPSTSGRMALSRPPSRTTQENNLKRVSHLAKFEDDQLATRLQNLQNSRERLGKTIEAQREKTGGIPEGLRSMAFAHDRTIAEHEQEIAARKQQRQPPKVKPVSLNESKLSLEEAQHNEMAAKVNPARAETESQEGDIIKFHVEDGTVHEGTVTGVFDGHYAISDESDGLTKQVPFSHAIPNEQKTAAPPTLSKTQPATKETMGSEPEAKSRPSPKSESSAEMAGKPEKPAASNHGIDLPGISDDLNHIPTEYHSTAKILSDLYSKIRGAFENMGVKGFQMVDHKDSSFGLAVNLDDPTKIELDLPLLARNIEKLGFEEGSNRLEAALDHELRHIALEKAAGDNPEQVNDTFDKIWKGASPHQQKTAIDLYDKGTAGVLGTDKTEGTGALASRSDAIKGREYMRMISALHATGKTDELADLLTPDSRNLLQKVVDYLKSVLTPIDPTAKKILADAESLLKFANDHATKESIKEKPEPETSKKSTAVVLLENSLKNWTPDPELISKSDKILKAQSDALKARIKKADDAPKVEDQKKLSHLQDELYYRDQQQRLDKLKKDSGIVGSAPLENSGQKEPTVADFQRDATGDRSQRERVESLAREGNPGAVSGLIRGEAGTSAAEPRSPSLRTKEYEALKSIAARTDKVIPLSEIPRTQFARGQEHYVIDIGNRVLKVTNPDDFGLGMNGAGKASAGDYFERLALSNHLFGDDMRWEGIVLHNNKLRVVTTQTHFRGEAPTSDEIDDFMESAGFTWHETAPGEGSWIRPQDNIVVYDANPKNFIKTPDGNLHVIDLGIEHPIKQVRDALGLKDREDNILGASPVREGFYSTLERTIEAKMPSKADATQIRALLKGNGVKDDEIKWSGIDDYLREHPIATKTELQNFLKDEGRVRIQTHELTYQSGELDPRTGKIHGEPKYHQYQLPGGHNYREQVFTLPDKTPILSKEIGQNAKAERDPKSEFSDGWIVRTDAYPNGIESNGRNEAEAIANAQRSMAGDTWKQPPSKYNYISSHFPEQVNYMAHMRLNDRMDTDRNPGTLIEEMQSDRHQQGREHGYKDDQPPLSEKELKDDWRKNLTQQIEQKKYDIADTERTSDRRRIEQPNDIRGQKLAESRIRGQRSELKDLQDLLAKDELPANYPGRMMNRTSALVPDAPFRKTWHEFLFRKALNDAVTSGKKWIGWTTGETQSERYDLSKQIKSVTAEKMGGKYDITAIDNNGHQVLGGQPKTAEELPNIVGKELGQKIIDHPDQKHTFSGLDLKVGGEGMKGFYDNILPQYVAKYVKKWGVKPEQSDIVTPRKLGRNEQYSEDPHQVVGPDGKVLDTFLTKAGAQEFLHGYPEGSTIRPEPKETSKIWKLPINDEMRKSVEENGQPLFSSPLPEKKIAPANHIGDQDLGNGKKLPLYNLHEDIPGHPKGSTVSAETLRKAGFEAPENKTLFSSATPESRAVASEALGFHHSDKIPEDIHKAVGLLHEAKDSILKTWVPDARSKEAAFTGRSLSAAIAKYDNLMGQADHAISEARDYFERQTPDFNLSVIDAIEQNKAHTDPQANEYSQLFRETNNRFRDMVRNMPNSHFQSFIENYFPHIWAQDSVGEVKKWIQSKIEGSRAFLKHRTIPTVAEALAIKDENGNSKFKLISDNPADLFLIRWSQMSKYMAGQEMLGDLKEAGIAKPFVKDSEVPVGMKQVDDRLGLSNADIPNPEHEAWVSAQANRSANKEEMSPLGEPPKTKRVTQHYYAPASVVDLLDNHLSAGLRDGAVYKVISGMANTMNQAQLGFSAFHLGFTTLDMGVSKLAYALESAVKGDVLEAGKAIGSIPKQLVSPIHLLAGYFNPSLDTHVGSLISKEMDMPGSQGPEIAALAHAVIQAGGANKMDPMYANQMVKSFSKAWRQGNKFGAAWRAPLAAMEIASRPIMEYLVPRQKLAVFADLARMQIKSLGPDAKADDVRKVMQKAWASVDNRMGQLRYDNLYWNKTAKDLSMIAVRSVGWNLGSYREILGGLKDWGQLGLNKATGKEAEFTHRMAYTLALPMLVGSIGTMINYLYTGEAPKEMRDYFFPKTGEKDGTGHNIRLALPSYMKDVAGFAHQPAQTLVNKANPVFSMLGNLWQNKDFYGTEIRHTDDNYLMQGAEALGFVAKSFEPFAITGAARIHQQGASPAKMALPFFGVTPAAAWIDKSKAEIKAQEINEQQMPPGAKTQEQTDKSQKKSSMMQQLAVNDPMKGGSSTKFAQILREAVQSGVISRKEIDATIKRVRMTPLEREFHHMNYNDAVKVWNVATRQEKEKLLPIFRDKMHRAKEGGAEVDSSLLKLSN